MEVGEVTPTSSGDSNLLSNTIGVFDYEDLASAFSRFDRAE
jgi:hypothetical protein